MNTSLLSRIAGRSLLALAFPAALITADAQTPAVKLDACVVSASRTPQDPSLASSDVTLVSLAGLQDEQVTGLGAALAETPGVTVVNSGAFGSQGSVYLRGADSDHTLFVVDGVRLNTGNATYYNFLGGADLAGLDRIEVLLGPQSLLYGSSAMGGVILLDTAHGCGPAAGSVSAYAGSFNSLGGQAAVQGGTAGTGYSVSLARAQTDNDRPYNAYKDWTYSARLEGNAASWLLVGATVRGLDGHYEEPGAVTYPAPGDVRNSTDLVTAYAEAKAGPRFSSRLTAAWYQDEYTWDKGSPYGYYARNTRGITDWQNTWEAATWAEIVAGVNAEWSAYQSGGMTTDRSLAEYASAILRPAAGVEVTGGLRHDDFNAEGSATTGRAGAAYLMNGGATKLRATYGTGFNAPTPADRYGAPPYYLPNPAIRPESSRGWDAGIDQKILSGAVTVEATYFENRFSDLLEYQVVDPVAYTGEEVNVGRATTRGAEFGLNGAVTPVLTMHAAYTYLDARDDDTGRRLIRRPRHTVDGGLDARITRELLVGAGVRAVADRLDGAYAPSSLPGYTTFRIHASYAFRPDLLVKVRVENLFNKTYQEVAGYPALPRAVYGGVEWKF